MHPGRDADPFARPRFVIDMIQSLDRDRRFLSFAIGAELPPNRTSSRDGFFRRPTVYIIMVTARTRPERTVLTPLGYRAGNRRGGAGGRGGTHYPACWLVVRGRVRPSCSSLVVVRSSV